MAHFAELDDNNIVLRVVVIDNEDIKNKSGYESENLGIEFCQQLFGFDTRWKQTSYNNKFQARYAGIGFTYDSVLDAFIPPRPYPSWILNQETIDWEAPIPEPALTEQEQLEGSGYTWDETEQKWNFFNAFNS